VSPGQPAEYGSDLIVDTLKQAGVDIMSMNPGATLSGIHQSVAEGRGPELVLALNEVTAVSIADGYYRRTGRPMAVALHNLVGLQAGCMAVFNAWANQAAMFVVGGSGPRAASLRRPWIDWVHTPRGQGLTVRDYVKWDDEPSGFDDLAPSIRKGMDIATMAPQGPVYVTFDTALQEGPVPPGAQGPSTPPTRTSTHFALADDAAKEIAGRLAAAKFPVVTADFVGRSRTAFEALVRLAEAFDAPVVDLGARHNFPTGHQLDATPAAGAVMAEADLVLALDPRDPLYGVASFDRLGAGGRRRRPAADIIEVSLNAIRGNGYLDASGSGVVGSHHVADTAVCLDQITAYAPGPRDSTHERLAVVERLVQDAVQQHQMQVRQASGTDGLFTGHAAAAVAAAVAEGPWVLANGEARGWTRRTWDLSSWNSYLGRNVGAGLGYGMGASIGAALAAEDDTIVVNLQNDGDLMSTASSLWTAAAYQLPVLTVTLNNRTYLQDRNHQAVLTDQRARDMSTIGRGVDLDHPTLDLAMLARSQGIEARGPLTTSQELSDALAWATPIVRNERRPVLLDVMTAR
jgi:thiamine pyrophosphate-dependent acetolactate synthase large subunit-like protein